MTLLHPVVVISGKIASGKSAFASALAAKLDLIKVGFGDEVRATAEVRGLPLTREVLQPIGESLVNTQPCEFCAAVLKRGSYRVGQGLVIEGLRHIEMLTVLRQLVLPAVVVHIHVSSPDELRTKRMEERGRAGEMVLAVAEAHSTEAQLKEELPRIADVRVDGSLSVEGMVAIAVAFVRARTV